MPGATPATAARRTIDPRLLRRRTAGGISAEITPAQFRRRLRDQYAALGRELHLVDREIIIGDAETRRVLAIPASATTAAWTADTVADFRRLSPQSFNATLLLTMLTFLTYGRILYKGPPGFGKTTTAELWGRAIYGLPLDLIQAATIYGNDRLTEEKVIARFHMGRLVREGEEEVHERLFALLPFKMLDELNRIPSHMLSLFYQIVDRSLHVYGNEHLEIPPGSLIATINERVGAGDTQKSGSFAVPRPLYDRFDACLVVPGLNPHMFHTLLGKPLLEGRRNGRVAVRKTTRRNITRGEIEAMQTMWAAKANLEVAQDDIESVALPPQLAAQIEFFLAQIFYCEQLAKATDALFWANKAYRQKRSLREGLCDRAPECHGKGRVCEMTDTYQPSVRAQQSLIKFSRALAWYRADESTSAAQIAVHADEIRALLPFTLAHRVFLEEDESSEAERHTAIFGMWDKAMAEYARPDIAEVIAGYTTMVTTLEGMDAGEARQFIAAQGDQIANLMNSILHMNNPARVSMSMHLAHLLATA